MHKTCRFSLQLIFLLFFSKLTYADIRLDPSVYNSYFYLNTYPDLKAAFGTDTEAAKNHWLHYGFTEGRQAVATFNVNYYLSIYPDLQAAFGSDHLAALNHWLSHGKAEGRRGAAGIQTLPSNQQTRLNDVSFAWSNNGEITGMTCTHILEGTEPLTHGWQDNYFCTSQDLGLAWSSAGPIAGKQCTHISETSDPHTWNDNFLCAPNNSHFTFEWHSAGSRGHNPVKWSEPYDPHTWDDNFLNITSFKSDKTLNQESWVTAHNAHAVGCCGGFANQQKSILDQLQNYSVRGLMLDIQFEDSKIELHHSDYNFGGFIETLQSSLQTFLQSDANAVVTIDFEVDSSEPVTYTQLASALDALPGIRDRLFNPWDNVWASHTEWPTKAELIAQDQRVIVLIDEKSLSKKTANDNRYAILHRPEFTTENMWSQTGSNQCDQRHHFNNSTIDSTWSHAYGWSRLFTMNHFGNSGANPEHSHTENNWDGLYPRIEKTCIPNSGGSKPNMIAVDYVSKGDVQEIAEVLTHGGILLFEGNNATQDHVCGIQANDHRSFSAGEYGCENDEARSGKLIGVKAGTKFAFYDSPNGDMQDDYVSIFVKKNIGTIGYIINTFQNSYEDEFVKVHYTANNGLDGKISKFEVSPSGSGIVLPPFEPTVTFYEGNNGTQNIVCTLTLSDNTINFKNNPYGCDNDEARSAVFKNVKSNTQLYVFDHPDGHHNDDIDVILFKKGQDIYTLNSFESNIDDSAVRTSFKHHNGLDGKVSRVQIVRNWQKCADEGGTCVFNGSKEVTYGAGNSWLTQVQFGSAQCNTNTFGSDPAIGVAKSCYMEPDWTFCALQGETCNFSGSKNVHYGAGKGWTYDTFHNSAYCGFGGDPAFGLWKACFTN